MGRFISPDFNSSDDDPEPVTYANLDDPQSLNFYSYVENDPLSRSENDGHFYNGLHCANCHQNMQSEGDAQRQRILYAQLMYQALEFMLWDRHFNKPAATTPANTSTETQSTPADPNQNKDTKPKRVSNAKHHPGSKSPEPRNVQELYDNAIKDANGRWWAKDSDGVIHRFAPESNGETHWNGSTAGPDPIRMDDIPISIRNALK